MQIKNCPYQNKEKLKYSSYMNHLTYLFYTPKKKFKVSPFSDRVFLMFLNLNLYSAKTIKMKDISCKSTEPFSSDKRTQEFNEFLKIKFLTKIFFMNFCFVKLVLFLTDFFFQYHYIFYNLPINN